MKETECNICGAIYMYETDRLECEVKDYDECEISNQVAQEVLIGNNFSVCDGCKYFPGHLECEWKDEEAVMYADEFCYAFEQDEARISACLAAALKGMKVMENR